MKNKIYNIRGAADEYMEQSEEIRNLIEICESLNNEMKNICKKKTGEKFINKWGNLKPGLEQVCELLEAVALELESVINVMEASNENHNKGG